MSHRHNAEMQCEYEPCGKAFTYYSAPSIPERHFCSPSCRNKARAHVKDIPCPICGTMFYPVSFGRKGRKQTCSQSCGSTLAARGREPIVWTDSRVAFLKEHYSDKGGQFCAEKLGLTRCAITAKASKLDIKLTPQANQRIVHDAARSYMLESNPMKRPEVAVKLQVWRDTHPAEHAEHMLKLRRGLAETRKGKPSKLQLSFWLALEQAGIEFEYEYEIKPKFYIDAAIPSKRLALEIDGCYWHWHKECFPNATDNQLKQRRKDHARDAYLHACGWTVLRFWECEFKASPRRAVGQILKVLQRL